MRTRRFDITVTFVAPTVQNVQAKLAGSYTGTQNGAEVTGEVTGDATGERWTETFTLKGGESVTFTGLLEGTAYTVTEDDYRTEGLRHEGQTTLRSKTTTPASR